MSRIITVLLLLSISLLGFSQNGGVGIGTSKPHPSAALDVQSKNGGLLMPRLSTGQIREITDPAQGLMVFDKGAEMFSYFDGKGWVYLIPTEYTWHRTVNDLCYTTGNVGIGTCEPKNLLHLHSDTSDVRMRFSVTKAAYIVGIDETEGSFYIGEDSSGIIAKTFNLNKGFVGVGIDKPKNLVHIYSDDAPASLRMTHSGSNAEYIVGIDETEGSFYIAEDSASITDRLMVFRNRLVGIGAAEPKSLLHLHSGDIPTQLRLSHDNTRAQYIVGIDETEGSFLIGRDSAGTLLKSLVIDSFGRVGINRIDTTAKLFVDGNIKASNLTIDDGVNAPYSLSSSQGDYPWKNQSIGLYKTTSFSYSNSGYTKIAWDEEYFNHDSLAYKWSQGGQYVEFMQPGVYQIFYSVGGSVAVLGESTTIRLFRYHASNGNSYGLNGSKATCSHLIGLTGNASVGRSLIIELGAGDKIWVEVTGTGNISGSPDYCAFNISKLY